MKGKLYEGISENGDLTEALNNASESKHHGIAVKKIWGIKWGT